jgi:hypothetical protein
MEEESFLETAIGGDLSSIVRDTNQSISFGTDARSSADRSSKYGVTYPRSESTGGGISEFLFP